MSQAGVQGPVGDYFNIIEKKHGSFLPDHTSRKRKKQLDKCSSAGSDVVEKINNKSLAACAGCDQGE